MNYVPIGDRDKCSDYPNSKTDPFIMVDLGGIGQDDYQDYAEVGNEVIEDHVVNQLLILESNPTEDENVTGQDETNGPEIPEPVDISLREVLVKISQIDFVNFKSNCFVG